MHGGAHLNEINTASEESGYVENSVRDEMSESGQVDQKCVC